MLSPRTVYPGELAEPTEIVGELSEIVPEVVFDFKYGEAGKEDFCRIASGIDQRAKREEKTNEWWMMELYETMSEAGCPTPI